MLYEPVVPLIWTEYCLNGETTHTSARLALSKGERLTRFVDFLSERHRIIDCRKQECQKRLRRFEYLLGIACPTPNDTRDIEKLITTVEEICTRPFTPATVQDALGISSRERIRWTRDGKLRSIGTKMIKDRGRFSLTLYSVEDVARLLMSPEILASWRTRPVSCPSR
ncbi:hypothetical protein HK13_03340 [Acetobacter indonesiensis]|nr:hypothetical protein HK13_03340 [Acetobacter indonesiensis]